MRLYAGHGDRPREGEISRVRRLAKRWRVLMRMLDTLIAETAPSVSVSLDGVEAGAWTRVARLESRREQRRLRAAALAVAAVIGGLTGGVSTAPINADRGELSIFNPRVASMSLQLMEMPG